jgi:histidinol-phosphate/aromatic aminotransferase/cobyric acid decarboxylase-like protein
VAISRALGIEVLDLSMSLNPVAPDMTPIIARHLGALGRYPDPANASSALATCLDVDPQRVVLTNGGAEAIHLVADVIGGGSVQEPDFSLYPRAGGPRWRSNPHSPTGQLAADEDTADVWDEAFYPLATGTWTRGDGTWVVGSLTKVLACPGLRAGYVLAPDGSAARQVRARQPEWSVNGLVCEALPELLALIDLPHWTEQIAALRNELLDGLRAHGFEPEPSDANWMLVKATGLRDHLARRGIAVRDCASFGLPDHVRIAVPNPTGMARLMEALST